MQSGKYPYRINSSSEQILPSLYSSHFHFHPFFLPLIQLDTALLHFFMKTPPGPTLLYLYVFFSLYMNLSPLHLLLISDNHILSNSGTEPVGLPLFWMRALPSCYSCWKWSLISERSSNVIYFTQLCDVIILCVHKKTMLSVCGHAPHLNNELWGYGRLTRFKVIRRVFWSVFYNASC